MGYAEVLLGNAIRGKLIENRREAWRERLRTDHALTDAELQEVSPYVEYVCHFGSWTELVALVAVFLPFALILGAILVGSGGLTLTMLAAVLTGSEMGTVGIVAVIFGLSGLFALLLLGGIVYFLYKRYRRYRLASEIDTHLRTEPRRLAAGEITLPKSREEIATMNDETTVSG